MCDCVFCILLDVNSSQKGEFLVSQVLLRRKSVEALKWVSSSLQDSVYIHMVCCAYFQVNENSCKGIMLFTETLKKESSEWLFLFSKKSSVPCLFSSVKTLSGICYLVLRGT